MVFSFTQLNLHYPPLAGVGGGSPPPPFGHLLQRRTIYSLLRVSVTLTLDDCAAWDIMVSQATTIMTKPETIKNMGFRPIR